MPRPSGEMFVHRPESMTMRMPSSLKSSAYVRALVAARAFGGRHVKPVKPA